MSDEHPAPEVAAGSWQPDPHDPEESLRLVLSPDKLRASLEGKVPQGLARDQVQRALVHLIKAHGISFGVDRAAVLSALDKLSAGEEISAHLIAQGKPPQAGQDAVLEELVEVSPPRIGALDAQGRRDFKDRGPAPQVEAGTVLARLLPAREGTSGRDVQSHEVLAPEPRWRRLAAGPGVEVSPDGFTLTAAQSGVLLRDPRGRLCVLPLSEINDDLTRLQDGRFEGLMLVEGAIKVEGRVEAASLEAEALEAGAEVILSGDLVVLGGIAGAQVTTEGSVYCRFLNNARISCGGDLVVENEVMQSQVHCRGRVVVSPPEGRIVNSEIIAQRGVLAGQIVSSGSGSTLVRLGLDQEEAGRIEPLQRKAAALRAERAQLRGEIEEKREELKAMEEELRQCLTRAKDPAHEADRKNLLAQASIIKPMRQSLLEEIAQGRHHLTGLSADVQELHQEIRELKLLDQLGSVSLEVHGKAEAGLKVEGPHASLTLDESYRHFRARERREAGVKGGSSQVS